MNDTPWTEGRSYRLAGAQVSLSRPVSVGRSRVVLLVPLDFPPRQQRAPHEGVLHRRLEHVFVYGSDLVVRARRLELERARGDGRGVFGSTADARHAEQRRGAGRRTSRAVDVDQFGWDGTGSKSMSRVFSIFAFRLFDERIISSRNERCHAPPISSPS